MRQQYRLLLLIPVSILVLFASSGAAQVRPDCADGISWQGTVVAVKGDVTARDQTGSPFEVLVGIPLCPLDRIVTGSGSSFDFRQAGKNTIIISSSNAVTVIPAPESECVTLLSGILAFVSSVVGRHCVRTPFIDAGIEGTEAIVAVEGETGDSFVLVRAGEVGVVDRRDPRNRLLLEAGPVKNHAAAFATQTQRLIVATPENVPAKFRDLLLRPEGATDWAVYFPPLLFGTVIKDPVVREAAALLDGGDPAGADRMLSTAHLEGRAQAAALALRAIIAVTLNDAASGEALADDAVALDPGFGAAQIARSYALQGLGQLDLARDAVEAAVEETPDDAYAWARLAELELTIGNRRAARRAVVRSLELAETALARSIEGFAALAAYEFDAAEADFQRAIEIDSRAPLPRLGLGLAFIRQGRLNQGRLEIETAVALDPRRASLRTWLGRAYLEERRPEKAEAQLELAQEGDPDDPNAYLFSSLARFELNDPIGALHELETAEDVGQRRVVVRSGAGLAEDEAVRSVAAGRTFDVLGFDVLATQKAARAVDLFPTSPDAHRFLFDSYRGRPGYEIAQTSELLKYQLLSPPTNQLVQPSLSEPDLGLLTIPGVSRATFYEFSPLFNRDGWFGAASGTVGNNGAMGDEVAFSYLNRNFSLSIGQYHVEDDGFRFNDEVEHDVVSLLAKYAPTPEVTVTAEARDRRTAQGDRFPMLFADPKLNMTEKRESHLFRLGVHAKATSSLDLLVVGTMSLLDEENQDISSHNLDTTKVSSHTLNLEFQGVHQFEFGHVTAGARRSRTQGDGTIPGSFPLDRREKEVSLYAYSSFAPTSKIDLTAGLSYNMVDSNFVALVDSDGDGDLEEEPSSVGDISQVNPKFGIRAEVTDGVILRGVLARTLKPIFLGDQMLEPTTVAGFAQFFDDLDYADAWTAGAGADLRITKSFWVGAEYLDRSLEIPASGPSFPETYHGEEHSIMGYANATIGSNLALSGSVEFSDNSTEVPERPGEVKSLMVPVSARYFHPSGFFAAAEAIWFNQSAEGFIGTDGESREADETGFLLNGAIGYRLPRNRGLISLEVENLLNSRFNLQNGLVNSARPSARPLAEGLSLVARATVSF